MRAVRVSLVALLVLSQFAVSAASPLFVCMRVDGSIGLDGGPQACSCESLQVHDHGCGSHEAPCAHQQDDSLPADGLVAAPLDCHCQHLQVTMAQVGAIVRAATTIDVGCECLPTATDSAAAPADLSNAAGPRGPVGSFALASLATVMLRC